MNLDEMCRAPRLASWRDVVSMVCDCDSKDEDVETHAEFCPYRWLEYTALVTINAVILRIVIREVREIRAAINDLADQPLCEENIDEQVYDRYGKYLGADQVFDTKT